MVKITRRDFTPDPQNAQDPEIQALYALVDAFVLEMKGKLFKKFQEGWTGWDMLPEEAIRENLRIQAAKMDPVDLANFAAFLWNARGGK